MNRKADRAEARTAASSPAELQGKTAQTDGPVRSIRVSLERQDIFVEQLAAVLMASPHGRASLMFPMVSGVDEIRAIKSILEEVKSELVKEGHPFNHDMRFGIMVELPAAVQEKLVVATFEVSPILTFVAEQICDESGLLDTSATG